MDTSYYKCRDCGSKFSKYSWFCPQCNGEKTMEYKEIGGLQDLLINLVCTITPEDFQMIVEATFLGNQRISLNDLLKEIKDLSE